MQKIRQWVVGIVLIFAAGQAGAATAWSTQDYDLYPGDFNGDGLTDLLYISKDGRHANGIVLSDGAGLNVPMQSWGNAYLGIPWSDGTYNVIVADFDGDGKADILLQRKTPGDHYLLLTDDTGINAIAQTIPNNAAGVSWSADAHGIVAGDFNGDGRADVFLQTVDVNGLNAIVTIDESATFSATQPAQVWGDGYLGFDWAVSESTVHAGDFNGDGLADLLIQARPTQSTIKGLVEPAQYAPNSNGVVLARAKGQPFALEGVQAWGRNGFGADWSPLDTVLIVKDFNADGRADALLQGASEGLPSYLLTGNAAGAIFTLQENGAADGTPTADHYRILAGNFVSGAQPGLYLQAQSPTGGNLAAAVGQRPSEAQPAELPLAANVKLATAPTNTRVSALALQTVTSAGRTPGQFAVSAMGAATYQIPIWTPPGARGIEPKLALVYTSGSPDGVMGPGWNLAGLSAIARCNKTYADNNGSPAPVRLGTSDDFCIDGNRMRVTSGTYGAAGSVYQTEVANFSRITAYGTAGNGPSYFIVEGKDGLIYEYGNTTDSKATIPGITTPYAWMLNKVRDRESSPDNMIITYSTTSGSIQPSTIQYTQTPSTNGSTYPYTVSFTYQSRVTNLDRYVAGGDVQQTQVMAKINVQSSGTSVRQYNLTYATASTTQRDRLSSVQECGGSAGTDCLRAATFTYQNGTAGIAGPTTASGSGATVAGSLRAADIDGDGRDDLVFSVGSTVWVQFATSSGFGSPINTGAAAGARLDDFLGVGRNCLVVPSTGNNWTSTCWNTSTGSFVTTTFSSPAGSSTITQCASADYDGDGKADVVCFGSPNPTYVPILLFKSTSSGGTMSFAAATTIGSISYSINVQEIYAIYGNNDFPQSNVRHMDFDGDGRDDLLVYQYIIDPYSGSTYQFLYDVGSATFSLSGSYVQGGFAPVRWNDDGCTDIASGNYIYISKCNGSVSSGLSLPASPTLFVDWDGDGRTDALAKVSGTWQVYRSLGTGAATGVSTGIAASSGQWITLDKNGDGESDLAYAASGSSNAIYYGLHNGAFTPPDLATSIADGWGVTAAPAYVPITTSNYTPETGAVFPEMDFQGAAYVVSQVSQTDGIGGNYTTSYWYFGARVNRQGRGFEGFEKTQAQDSRNGLYHLVNYYQTFPYTGLVAVDRTYQSNGTSLISQTNNTFQVMTVNDLTDTTGSKCKLSSLAIDTRCFPYLSHVSSANYELTGTQVQATTADYTLDSWGNQTNATTTTTDMDSSSPEYNKDWTSTIANTSITNDTTNWCLGKPTVTTSTNTEPDALPAGNATTQTRHVNHVVDAVKCRYTSETIEPTTSLEVATTFGYDTCGNVNSVSVVGRKSDGTAMTARTTTSSYGTRCTFPESVTNALSQATLNGYNYSYGVKSSTTDPNGIIVSWGYDNFARRTSETRPDGTSTTWSYTDCVSATCFGITDNLRLQVTETLKDSTAATVRSHVQLLDAFERLKYDQAQRVLGTWTYTKTTYDQLGRKVDVYQPYSSAGNGYHHFSYDVLNRPTSDQLYNASGTLDRTTGMAYAGLLTTLTNAKGANTWKWSDVTGKLRRIIDPDPANGLTQGATTYYDYDPFGNLVKITDAGGAQTTYVYNIRGFKTASSDPDTGSWSYTPDSLNELVSQTDAKSQPTSFDYDLLGRMTSRVEPESATATTWTFGTSAAAHEIGRLKSVSKPDGYAESYTFDSIGRPASTTYTLDTTYTVNYAYNTLGAVDTVKYPTSSSGYNFTLKYLYSFGFAQQVKDNAAGTVFWSLSTANDYSSPTTEVLGNGATITSSYQPWTNDVLTRQVGTGGSTTNLQNLSYQWDLNGNLQQRQDLRQTLTEAFSYDTLNRLSGGTLNSVANLSVGYSAQGNITSKSDAGSFDYATAQSGCSYTGLPAQPHAVRKAGTTVYCYDANGNMVSRGGSTISWYSYNQPNQIYSGSNSTQFNYNANHQRWRQVAVDGTGTTTTWYIGGILEKLSRPGGAIEYRHLIPAGSGMAIYLRKPDGSNSTTYVTTDHLGSGDLILDSAANVLARESFTPFGARRGSNWTGVPTSADYTTFSNTTRRGFTGHEMLDAVGLVNMNGRVYDPLIGRFLSADPVIQTINLSQALNPYSYVMNMPLTLTDPSGYSWLSKLFHSIGHFLKKWGSTIIDIAFAIAGMPFIGSLVASAFGTALNGGNLQSFLSGFAVGTLAGFVAGPIAGKLSGFFGMAARDITTQIFRGIVAGGIAGGLTAEVFGGSFAAGFWGGALAGGLTAGVVGEVRKYRTEEFIKNNLKCEGGCNRSILDAIRDAGQSAIGQRLMAKFRSVGEVLNVLPEDSSPSGTGLGPHVAPGTNDMYFNGDAQHSPVGGSALGAFVAGEPWGPSLDDATTFIHELNHTLTGGNMVDPGNVAYSENMYRRWMGTPGRNDYAILSMGQASEPVPTRSLMSQLIHTW